MNLFKKKFVLYYKTEPVMELFYENEITNITGIGKIYNDEFKPLFLNYCNEQEKLSKLRLWAQQVRCVPENRTNLKKSLKIAGVSSTSDLIQKSMGFSITDNYWYGKNIKSGHLWDKISYHKNKFSTDIGDIFVNGTQTKTSINYFDPSVTTNGTQNKMWFVSNGKEYLLKADDQITLKQFYPQAANEIIGARVAECLQFKHIDYELCKTKSNNNACICENFTNENEEYLPLSLFVSNNIQENKFETYKKVALSLGITENEFQDYVSKFCSLICVVGNADLNMGNFGFLYNKETKTAKLSYGFDNGNSNGVLYISKTMSELLENTNMKTSDAFYSVINNMIPQSVYEKTIIPNTIFGETYSEILQNISNYDFIDIEELKKIPNYAKEIYYNCGIDNKFSEKLISNLEYSIKQYVLYIEQVKIHENLLPIDNEKLSIKGDEKNLSIDEKEHTSSGGEQEL